MLNKARHRVLARAAQKRVRVFARTYRAATAGERWANLSQHFARRANSGIGILACLLACAWPALAVTVSGQVELRDSRHQSVRKHKNYSGVIVWLEPVGRPLPPAPGKTAVMLQKGKQFIPHVLAVAVGTTVEFPNLDPIFHNAFSDFAGQSFDTGLYPPGGTQKVVFRREGIVRVFCNIHSTMSAVIAVLNTPHFAVTAADGSFELPGVAPGEYLLHVWHERSTEATLHALARKVTVTAEPVNGAAQIRLPVIRISEQGYLPVPHKNKYGLEYPREPERGPYPGGPS
jgi:plastocyanin